MSNPTRTLDGSWPSVSCDGWRTGTNESLMPCWTQLKTCFAGLVGMPALSKSVCSTGAHVCSLPVLNASGFGAVCSKRACQTWSGSLDSSAMLHAGPESFSRRCSPSASNFESFKACWSCTFTLSWQGLSLKKAAASELLGAKTGPACSGVLQWASAYQELWIKRHAMPGA